MSAELTACIARVREDGCRVSMERNAEHWIMLHYSKTPGLEARESRSQQLSLRTNGPTKASPVAFTSFTASVMALSVMSNP